MAEMVSMGVGNKAFRDLAPSEEAINDRTVDYVLKCRGSRQAAGGVGEEGCMGGDVNFCHQPLPVLPAGPWPRWALACPNLTLSLTQKFALGPLLLWPHLTVTAATWGPGVPFLETPPLAPYWGPSTCTCTETRLFWESAGPCILPASQRKQRWKPRWSWAVSCL